MHFEGKHSFFKNLASRIRNFKNIHLSLAKRHQAWACYYLKSNYSFISTGKVSIVLCMYSYEKNYYCTGIPVCFQEWQFNANATSNSMTSEMIHRY